MEFGCCHLFKECSTQGLCISKYKEFRTNCSYGKRLKQGFNFYSESYKEGKLYITIDDRQFYIGRRSKSGNWSYSFTDNEKSIIKKQLKSLEIEYTDKPIFSACKEEKATDEDRAYCQVAVTINGNKYNIKNFNIRALCKGTVSTIKDYFASKGVDGYIESIGKRTSNTISRSSNYKSKTKKQSRATKDNQTNNTQNNSGSVLKGQLSIFDISNVSFKDTTNLKHIE